MRLILREESSENKALYYEKLFARMNQASVIFKMQLCWGISKGYYKQMTKRINDRKMKEAHKTCQSSLQFFRIFKETLDNNKAMYPTMGNFKSQAKQDDFFKNL